jgi:hypothetical protein
MAGAANHMPYMVSDETIAEARRSAADLAPGRLSQHRLEPRDSPAGRPVAWKAAARNWKLLGKQQGRLVGLFSRPPFPG